MTDDGVNRPLALLSTNPDLLRRLRADPADPSAWSELVRRYGPHVYHWCLRWKIQPSDAADVTQDVLLRLVRCLTEFDYREQGSFRGYLKTLVRYAVCDFLRERSSRAEREGGLVGLDEVEAREDLENRLQQEFDQEILALAMTRVAGRVDPRTWEAFRLLAVERMPGAEVARRLDMNVAAAYKARSNVVRLLQETVRALEGETGVPEEAGVR